MSIYVEHEKGLLTQKRQNIFAWCPLNLGEGYDKIELFKIEIFKIGGYAMKKENRSAEKGNKAALNAEKAEINENKTGLATENSIVKTDKAVSENEKTAGNAGKKVHNAEDTAKRVKNTALEAEKTAEKADKASGGAKQDVAEEADGAGAEEKRTRITAAHVFGGTKKFMDAYGRAMFPLCEETGLPMPAIDMLLFLANNPGMTRRKIYANCGVSSLPLCLSTLTRWSKRGISNGKRTSMTDGSSVLLTRTRRRI